MGGEEGDFRGDPDVGHYTTHAMPFWEEVID